MLIYAIPKLRVAKMIMEKLPITVLIQTKNEELSIGSCIDSLNDFDEIIVVDSDSTDKTTQIAKSHGASVVNFTWNGLYPKKKQWQINSLTTKHKWILFMDADESPTPELVIELRTFLNTAHKQNYVAADIKLNYVFTGRQLRYGHTVIKRVLLQRGLANFPVIDDLGAPGMGELEGHYQPVIDGNTAQLKGRILHNDIDPVRTWFDRHNKYSDWEAYLRSRPAIREETASRRSVQGRIFDAVPFKPLVFFVYSYGIRKGFLDGRAGFDYAIALSAYYWQIGVKVREIRISSD